MTDRSYISLRSLFTLMLICLSCSGLMAQPQNTEELEAYFTRSITMQGLDRLKSENPEAYAEDIQLLKDMKATFIRRVAGLWGGEARYKWGYFDKAASVIHDLKKDNPADFIAQAAVFEIVSIQASQVKIPTYVAEEFGLEEDRNFVFDSMIFLNGRHYQKWDTMFRASAPDFSRRETKMWFYYLSTQYIDAGYKSLHYGQCFLMDDNDPGHVHLWDIVSRVRKYAKDKGSFILIDGGKNFFYYPELAENDSILAAFSKQDVNEVDTLFANARQLVFDFNGGPVRMQESKYANGDFRCVIDPRINLPDALYGGKSRGGIHPLGWEVESLPYLLEIDHTGPLPYDKGRMYNNPWVIWGWDEFSWLSSQSVEYQKYWLTYAYYAVNSIDGNGYLDMAGVRTSCPTRDAKDCYLFRLQEDAPDLIPTIIMLWDNPDLAKNPALYMRLKRLLPYPLQVPDEVVERSPLLLGE